MALAFEKIYTTEDIYELPEGKRAEIIDGRMFLMAPPSKRHQEIVGELYRIISNFIYENKGLCRPFIAPFAVFLEDDKNYVEPDIVVICDQNKLNDKGCSGTPDWIIEVVSPSSHRMDYMIKLFKYRTAGVREYWIVDPKDNSISVYNFENETMERYSFFDTVKAGIYDNFEIDFSKLKI